MTRHAEALAAGYVGLRAFENVLYVAGSIAILMMLTVSRSDAVAAGASNLPLLGVTLLAWHDWSVSIGTLIFAGMGSVMLNYVLYRSLLVPRWLSTWGLVGAALVFLYGLTGILGFDTGLGHLMILVIPLAVQEMVFAGWLIMRGFHEPPARIDLGADDLRRHDDLAVAVIQGGFLRRLPDTAALVIESRWGRFRSISSPSSEALPREAEGARRWLTPDPAFSHDRLAMRVPAA